eukprot:2597646-Amphidinium_carterae.1
MRPRCERWHLEQFELCIRRMCCVRVWPGWWWACSRSQHMKISRSSVSTWFSIHLMLCYGWPGPTKLQRSRNEVFLRFLPQSDANCERTLEVMLNERPKESLKAGLPAYFGGVTSLHARTMQGCKWMMQP